MKRMSILVTLIAALIAIPLTAIASALPITIDFSQTPTTDITFPHSVTIDNVTFYYDNTPAGNGVAVVNSIGITGDTGAITNPGPSQVEANNVLTIDFTVTPIPQIYKLLVKFSLPGISKDDPSGAFADLFLLGAWVAHVDVPIFMADPNATVQYSGTAFDQIFLSFSADAPKFFVSEVTYTPVPEPGTIILVAAGLLGLGVLRRGKKK